MPTFTEKELEVYVQSRIVEWETGGKARYLKEERELKIKSALKTAGNFKITDLPRTFSLKCIVDFELSLHGTGHANGRGCISGRVYKITKAGSSKFGIANSKLGLAVTGEKWWAYLTPEELTKYFRKVNK